MKELVIVSGKGGTGKTSLTAAFASLSEKIVLCDADVDAADLHLIMNPNLIRQTEFRSGNTAVINAEHCTGCGLCRQMCRWNAISDDYKVNSIDCEGCGVCVWFCPESAIDFPQATCGEWFVSDTRFVPMVHARLGIAEENSGKLVTLVRREAAKLAEKKGLDLILTDGPPGVGCPVIASIGGADAVLIVTEPTVSGIHDMERTVALAAHFKVPALVCINKFDLNIELSRKVESYAAENNITCVGRIAYDPIFTRAMVQAQNIFECSNADPVKKEVNAVWQKIKKMLKI
jgi:MinD superfamily P-loop ATPase